MQTDNLLLEGYEGLAVGIVRFALEDYTYTIESLQRYYKKLEKVWSGQKLKSRYEKEGFVIYEIQHRIKNLEDIEQFLHGKWIRELTDLDIESLFNETKRKLKEKGYRVDIMGLQITSDNKGVKIFAKDIQGSNGFYTVYTMGVSSKGTDGKYKNGYIPVKFKKGVTVSNKTVIKINNAFYVVNYGANDKAYTSVMITDFEVLQPGEDGVGMVDLNDMDDPFL